MHLFSLMGTVLTNVIMRTPAPSWIVMADEDGSMALATTGTDSTAVHSHSLLTGLLWMLQAKKGSIQAQGHVIDGNSTQDEPCTEEGAGQVHAHF
jgi:hypothetical protein